MARQSVPKLSTQQHQHLLAAYQLDQQLETDNKINYLRGVTIPASEWRAMPYGEWKHIPAKPPTQLRELLGQQLVDSDSTWKTLADLGLVKVEDRVVIPGPNGYTLPHVLMTTAGRKLVRLLTNEVRPKSPPRSPKPPQPEGLLPDQEWSVLAKLYENDYEGLPAVVYTHAMWSLSERGLSIGSPEAPTRAEKYTITAHGREFYHQYYNTNESAYQRGNVVPRPVLTAKHRAFWQQLRELGDEFDKALIRMAERPPHVVECEIHSMRIAEPVGTLYVEPYWYIAQAGKGIPLDNITSLFNSRFDTEAEALAAGQHKVEMWKQQLAWQESVHGLRSLSTR
jgi:hypothetical protein